MIQFGSTGGNDTVLGFDEYSTLAITDGTISNTISNYDDDTRISGSSDRDSIYNSGSKVTLNAGAGDDCIHLNSYYLSLNGGTGDDSIYCQRSAPSEEIIDLYR